MYTVGTAGLADKENRISYIGIALVLAVGCYGAWCIFEEALCAGGTK